MYNLITNNKTLWLNALFGALLIQCKLSLATDEPNAAVNDEFTEMSLHELMKLEVFTAASLLPTELKKAPGTAYNFGRDDLNRLGIRRLDDLLRYVPGLQLNQYRKRHQSIWARGMLSRTNDKLVLLIDGIPRRHLYYSDFSLGENFPVENIEKIEVILGPASSLYGANAFGGIISVTTREFAQQPQAGGMAEVGNNQRGKGTAWYNSATLQMFSSGLNQDAPYRKDRKTFIGELSKQELDEQYRDVFIKSKPLPELTLSAEYQRNETPFLFMPTTQDGFANEEPLQLTANYGYGAVDSGRVETQLYYTRDRVTEREWEQISQKLAYVERQNGNMAGLNIDLFHRFFTTHVFTLGGSWQHDAADNMDTVRYWNRKQGWLTTPSFGNLLSQPQISNNNFATYLQDMWEIDKQLTLTVGGRYDQYQAFGNYDNYRAALVYTPNTQQVFKLLYGTAIRVPTYREYLKVLEGTNFIPPQLKPEAVDSLEIGYVQQWEQTNLDLTVFHNTFKDYIYETPTPDAEDEYFTNSSNLWRLTGAELLLQHNIKHELHLRAGLSYLHTNVASSTYSNNTMHNEELPYPADWNGSLHLSYDVTPNNNIGIGFLWGIGREDTNEWNEDNPQDYVTLNIHGFGRINKNFSYAWGVDNLLNAKIYDAAADFSDDRFSNERSIREIWGRIETTFDL